MRWLRDTGFGLNFQGGGPRIDVDTLEKQLESQSTQASASLPQEVEHAHKMFAFAAKALRDGQFNETAPAMRHALRQVPRALRDQVMLDFEVMDRLTAHVHHLLKSEFGSTIKVAKLTGEEAGRMGDFWYQVAAGEIDLAKGAARY